jgi:hypothetical protein
MNGFFIDPSLPPLLWPQQGYSNAYVNSSTQMWTISTDANSNLYITIPVSVTNDVGGNVGQIIGNATIAQALQIGNWNIGADHYGNLVITNGTNQVIIGAGGNVANNGQSFITDGSPVWISNSYYGPQTALNCTASGSLVSTSDPSKIYTPSNWQASPYWQACNATNGLFPDKGSNLVIHAGNPFVN